MSNIKFKDLAKRGTAFALAVGLLSSVGLYAFPSLSFADALNPLTERTLLLSSSAPGYVSKDAAGNSTYAPHGSGPNGSQTGETFSFKVSTDSSVTGTNEPIMAFTLQYCTTAAGQCLAPGDNDGDADPNDDGSFTGSTRESNATAHPQSQSDFDVVGTFANDTDATPEDGEFVVLVNGVASPDWVMEAINAESEDILLQDGDKELTGKNNMIRLTNTGSGAAPTAGTPIQVIFRPSNTVYLTNPGSGAFFVKINTYKSATLTDLIPDVPATTNDDIIDGGVTVANVMTDSIHIQTKVLETMAFSVGTQNPDMVDPEVLNPDGTLHGYCDPIAVNEPLKLGNESEEFSLRVDTAFDAKSYWRLSSNSSGGASVYYSGYTLSNTVNDQIEAIGASPDELSHPGEEQFGLAYDNTAETEDTSEGIQPAANDNIPFPLVVNGNYDEGNGNINGGAIAAKFAFDPASLTVPALIATNSTTVVECATAKMRYVANIRASTPSGIYTAAVNYLAAPQY